jgi:hypothetical protein
LEFTVRGLTEELSKSDLRLHANGRLVSLRYTNFVKVGEDAENDSKTYRLLGLEHVSSAQATYLFTIEGPAGWIATTWDLV